MDFTDEAWLKIIFFLSWLQKLFKILKVILSKKISQNVTAKLLEMCKKWSFSNAGNF